MLSSIHPLGEAGRGNRYKHTASAFIVGSTVGGVGIALVLGALGDILARRGFPTVWLLVFGLGPLLAVRLAGRSLPSLARQVDENWLHEFRGWVYGFGFGVQLGAGVATYIRSTMVWVWLLAMVAVGSAPVAVGLGVVFGAIRGLSILSTRAIHSPTDLVIFHRRLAEGPSVRRFAWRLL